jgi:hypothetical protein
MKRSHFLRPSSEKPPVVAEDIADPDQEAGVPRKSLVEVVEDRRDLRNDDRHHQEEDENDHHPHDERIGQSATNLALKPRLLVQELREPSEHLFEGARRFARGDQVDVEREEEPGVCLERVRQGTALVDLITRVGECALQLGMVELVDQRAQGFDQRDTRTKQYGELPSGKSHVQWRDASE